MNTIVNMREERNAALDRAKELVLTTTRDAYRALMEAHGISSMVEDRSGLAFDSWSACSRAIDKLGFGSSLSDYSNAPGRTKYEVAAIFDHAKLLPL